MTTNSPATPLPWSNAIVGKGDSGEICEVYSCVSGKLVADYQFAADAAYIVKSANAYPQLVEALRECVLDIYEEVLQADDHPIANAHGETADKASTLLRSLGEKL